VRSRRPSGGGVTHRSSRPVAVIPLVAIAIVLRAAAQETVTAAPVVVTATRLPQVLTDVPAAVSVVGPEDVRGARRTVGLEESLNQVPGVFAQNSDNFAQDARIQIRGFGTRTAFGIREIKVLLDGLPETLPDGETELDEIDLGAIDHIEVLRGAGSSLYGNAAGGVIQLFTPSDSGTPWAGTRMTGGEFGLFKSEVAGGGSNGALHSYVHASYLQLGGFRDHSAVQRGDFLARLRYEWTPDTDATVMLTGVETPYAQDPGGLTRAQADANPQQARDLNQQLRADESVEQGRVAVVGRRRADWGELSAYGYALYRDFDNRLPITPAAGDGIVAFHRVSPGGGARYLLDRPLFGLPQRFTLGVDLQHQDDNRRRFAN